VTEPSLTVRQAFKRIPKRLPAIPPGAIRETAMLNRIVWELWWGQWRVRAIVSRRH